MARFKLSEEQADAILELRLYRLAKLEILLVQKELEERRAEAQKLSALLKSPKARWTVIKDELEEIKKKYADKRRTKVVGSVDEPEFAEEDFIVAEDANVILSTQGWVKRVREVKDSRATRLREGDSVLAVVAGLDARGGGVLLQPGRLLRGAHPRRAGVDRLRRPGAEALQARRRRAHGRLPLVRSARARGPRAQPRARDEPEPPFALAITRAGFGFRFSLRPHREPSTRAGRRFAKPKEGDEVLAVMAVGDGDAVVCVSGDGHVLGVPVGEIPALAGAGKGVDRDEPRGGRAPRGRRAWRSPRAIGSRSRPTRARSRKCGSPRCSGAAPTRARRSSSATASPACRRPRWSSPRWR